MPTRGGRPPMSARRVELVHGGSGVAAGEPRLEAHVLGKLLAAAAAAAAGRIRGRRPRAASRSGAGRDGRARRSARPRASRARRDGPAAAAAAALRPRPGGRCPRVTACSVSCGRSISISSAITARRCTSNGLKSGAEVARHVGEALRVEQREHLVVLAPQLAEPLHGQRVRRHDQAALDSARRAPGG